MGGDGRERYESSEDVRDAIAASDRTPLCTTKKKKCFVFCGLLIGLCVFGINYLRNMQRNMISELGISGNCVSWQCGLPYLPPAPPSPPDPPMMPWVQSEVVWGPAHFAGCFWSLASAFGVIQFFYPMCTFRCVMRCSLLKRFFTEKELAVQEVQARFLVENSSFDMSDVGWGKRAGIKDDPTKLQDVTRWDNFKCIVFGPGIAIYGFCSLSFLPAIEWPRTGLPQFFNLLSSPFSTFMLGSAASTGRRLFDAHSLAPMGTTIPILYFWITVGVAFGALILPGLLFLICFSSAAAAGKELPRGWVMAFSKGMKSLVRFMSGTGLALILRPMMSPFFCSTTPWGNQRGNDGFFSSTLFMNIDGLGEIGAPQYCWNNYAHWIAVLVSFNLTSVFLVLPLSMGQQRAVRWSRERGLFQNELRAKIQQADPHNMVLTESMQRSAMRVCDSYFEGVTYSKPFLFTLAITQVVNAYFGMGGAQVALVLPQLLSNVVLLVCVWYKPPTTDERENLLYRDLMILPIWTNVLALSTSADATALPLVWFLVAFLVILPGTGYHFYIKNKQHAESRRENGEGPTVKITTALPASDDARLNVELGTTVQESSRA